MALAAGTSASLPIAGHAGRNRAAHPQQSRLAGLSSHSPPPPAAQLSAACSAGAVHCAAVAPQPGGQQGSPAAGPFDWIDPDQLLDLFDRLLGIKPAGYSPSMPAASQQASTASAAPGAQPGTGSSGILAGQSRGGGDEQTPPQGSGMWWEPTRLFAALVRRCCFRPCYLHLPWEQCSEQPAAATPHRHAATCGAAAVDPPWPRSYGCAAGGIHCCLPPPGCRRRCDRHCCCPG